MTVKSVLDIDINSGEFQKFAEMYQKYQEQQAKTAAVAKQSGKEQVNTRNTFAQQVELMKLQARLAQESHTAQDKQQKTLAQSDRLWTSMAKSTKSVGSSIIDATRSLLSWTGILTGIGGLLGAGGLFGLDRMAHGVASDRQNAMGLGMSIGEHKAFQTNFSRVFGGDTSGFLNWISQMQSNPDKAATASALGFELSGNAETDALQALKALRAKSQEWDPALYGTMLNALHVEGAGVQDLRRMRTTGGAEWSQMYAGNQRDIGKFNIQENVAKQWQDFSTKLQEAGNTIFKVFVDGLTPLIGPLSHLSDAFVHFLEIILRKDGIVEEGINTVAGWLEKFSGSLGSPAFLKTLEQLTSDFGALATVVHVIANPLSSAQNMRNRVSSRNDAWGWLGRRNESALTGVSDLFHGRWGNLWHDAVGASVWGDMASGGKHQQLLAMVKSLERSGVNATSPKGAMGTYQLMPETARLYGAKNPFDPTQNKDAASRYLTHLEGKYGGDMSKILAAYNWGEGNVDMSSAGPFKYKGVNRPQGWMPQETRDYLAHAPGVTISIVNATGGNAIVQAAALAH